jgi:hypothetical protein
MISARLIATIRLAREANLRQPHLFPAALDAIGDQVDRFLDLEGPQLATLREAGRVMAQLLNLAAAPGADRPLLLDQIMALALQIQQLERVLRVQVLPRHHLPQLLPGLLRNTPFTVIQGGLR